MYKRPPQNYPTNAPFGFARNVQATVPAQQQAGQANIIAGVNFNDVMLQQQMQHIIQQGVGRQMDYG